MLGLGVHRDGTAPSTVDWHLAALAGSALASRGPRIADSDQEEIAADLEQSAHDVEGPICQLTRLAAGLPLDTVRIVDRPGWISTAANSMALLEASPVPRLTLSSLPGTIPAAVLLAYLSTGVLGQYDPFTGRHGTLVLVAPNILAAERSMQAVPADFRRWVCLHEVTHRVQFIAVPWLAGHLYGLVRVAAEGRGVSVSNALAGLADLSRDLRTGTRDLPERRGAVGLLRIGGDPLQRTAVDQLVTLGTLLEGHAEFVTTTVGTALIPTAIGIRAAFEYRRSRPTNPLLRLLRVLLGVDSKLAQYERGSTFVQQVVGMVGMERFNVIWTDHTTLPRPSEIDAPADWMRRVLH